MPPPVVEQNMSVYGDVVADLHLITERELYVLEAFEVLTAVFEDVRCQDTAEPDTDGNVSSAERRAVEALPQPQERFDPGVSLGVDLVVVLGLQGDVVGIEAQQRGASCV